jgi:arabinofuranosyltransferase
MGHESRIIKPFLVAFGTLLIGIVITANAWISDDAGLTLRSIDNLHRGFGPTFNISERVQAYTHPLWMWSLALVTALSNEYFFSTIAVSLICSIAMLGILAWRIDATDTGLALAAVGLLLSKSFIDYSTSGLENPLAHLLLASFAAVYLRHLATPHYRTLSLLAAAIVLNRQDHLLLIAPAIVSLLVRPTEQSGSRRIRWQLIERQSLMRLFIGVIPVALWFGFSLLYYGFLFPNTAYAKLNTDLARGELMQQGLLYLFETFKNDPLLCIMLLLGSWLSLHRGHLYHRGLALGIVLYGVYIISIGGDFMVGRFLTAPLIMASVLVATLTPPHVASYAVAVPLLLIGLINPVNPLVSNFASAGQVDPTFSDSNGVTDERLYYAETSGLLQLNRSFFAKTYPIENTFTTLVPFAQSANTITAPTVGALGLAVGPGVHVIDELALGDPLLARLPAVYNPAWRIGHFYRTIPAGYVESIERGENRISDPQLAQYYDALRLIVSGPVFDGERLRTIVAFNLGQYDYLVDRFAYTYPTVTRTTISDMQYVNSDYALPLTHDGLFVSFAEMNYSSRIALELSQITAYDVIFLNKNQQIGSLYIPSSVAITAPLVQHQLMLPTAIRERGYDAVHIRPRLGREQTPAAPLQVGRVIMLADDAPALAEVRLGHGWIVDGRFYSKEGQLTLDEPLRPMQFPASFVVTTSITQSVNLQLTIDRILPAVGTTTTNATIGVWLDDTLISEVPAVDQRTLNEFISVPAGIHHLRLTISKDGQALAAQALVRDINVRPISQMQAPDLTTGPGIAGLFHDGWYRFEPSVRLRWAGSPAQIRVFVPTAGTYTMRWQASGFLRPNGSDTESPLRVNVNNQAPQQITAVLGVNEVAVTLKSGLNLITLEAVDGAIKPSDVLPGSADERPLSMAISGIEIR